ncbi:MAG: hypothetical protein A2Y38_12925 [Spirochaetes bacterium GWB1_59_5]|nr:MAG: hypothetical protein A2Y38_12925 [Spirochaetes bacterium GWB1_59_5]
MTATLSAGNITWGAYDDEAPMDGVSGTAEAQATTAVLRAKVTETLLGTAIMLNIGSNVLRINEGVVYKTFDPVTGLGEIAGSLSPDGIMALSSTFTADAPNAIVIKSLVSKESDQYAAGVVFRTPGAPLRPGSFYLQAEKMADGAIVNATATLTGELSATDIEGELNHETGVVSVRFGHMVTPASDYVGEPWYDPENVEGEAIFMPVPVKADTIKYNCVIYSYIPLDASLIGLDPVRLPQDGRVPVFRKGDLIVIHHTLQTQMPSGLTAGQEITLPRGELTLVELYDAEGLYVPETLYSVNLFTGVIVMATPLDLSGFTEPLIALHRREEMSLASDVQINGAITMTQQITRAYPADETFVSSALAFGDLQSRVYGVFDQKTWGNVWSDDRIGDAANATYNTLNFPFTTTNRGAIPQRWALVFYSTEQFYVMGEQVGVIGEGTTNMDCQPVNPATNTPYFTVKYDGWGSGWASGNVVRFNTMAACAPIWLNRTTLQGPATEAEDEFKLHIRGAGN